MRGVLIKQAASNLGLKSPIPPKFELEWLKPIDKEPLTGNSELRTQNSELKENFPTK